MPTVLRIGRLRFYFWSRENDEPPHIHVESGDEYAKFWLSPIELAESSGYNKKELNQIRKLILKNEDYLLGRWNDYFKKHKSS